MSGPSDKAVEAGLDAYPWGVSGARTTARAIIQAAHDSALGLDRSVCLRDVVEALRQPRQPYGPAPAPYGDEFADFIEREFGDGSRPKCGA